MAVKITHLNYENISDLFIECFVEIKDVRNGILNNLCHEDKLPILNSSPSGSLQS